MSRSPLPEGIQVILVDSPMGPRPLHAPAGWTFDKTAKHLWSRFHFVVSERAKPQKRKRDEFVLDGQIEVMAIVLANSLGMTSWYWIEKARICTKLGFADAKDARTPASDPDR